MNWLDAQPDRSGPFGHAWDLMDQQRASGRMNPDDAAVAWWVFHATPAQHPAWEWYYVMGCHLRPVEGETRPATKHFPAATHELLVLAVDPKHAPPQPGALKFLQPPNAVVQFVCVQDDVAAQVMSDVAGAMCDGRMLIEEPGGNTISMLSLDAPVAIQRSKVWRSIIENAIEHILTGGHP